MKGRLNQPEHIEHMGAEQHHSNRSQRRDIFLHGSKQQKHEWKKKMQKPQRADYVNPTSGYAMKVPINFAWQISRVNNQELPEGNVGPKKDESQEQVS